MVRYELEECPYTAYYREQAGGGVSRVYSGASYQKGHGIGSFLGSLFRWVTPLFKKGAIALGHKAVDMGGKVLGDVTAGESVKDSARKRWKEMQEGRGYNRGIKRAAPGKNVSFARAVKRARSEDEFDKIGE